MQKHRPRCGLPAALHMCLSKASLVGSPPAEVPQSEGRSGKPPGPGHQEVQTLFCPPASRVPLAGRPTSLDSGSALWAGHKPAICGQVPACNWDRGSPS